MELIVVSSPRKKDGEVADVIRMFEAGLERFHMRKPGASKKYVKEFIEQIPKKYRDRIVIHSNHNYMWRYKLGGIHISKKHRKNKFKLRLKLMWYRMRNRDVVVTRSCHKLDDLSTRHGLYSYVFLSPVFDSISVNSLSGGFSKRGLTSSLENNNLRVIAMGGIEPKNFQEVVDLGFHGAAVLGYIWSAENSFEAFNECLQQMKQIN